MPELKSIAPVLAAAKETDRKMRGLFPAASVRNEAIAVRFTKQCLDRHVQWLREIYEIIPNLPKWESIRKVIPDNEQVLKDWGISWHHDHIHFSKAFPDNVNMPQLESEFINNFGATVGIRFDQAVEEYLKDIVGPGPDALRTDEYVYGKNMNEGLQTFVNDARKQAKKTWQKQPKWWRDANPFDDFWNGQFWQNAEFYDTIRENGFRLVTNKTTIDFGARAKHMMNEGLKNGDSWSKIARDINRSIGMTEIAQADGRVVGAGFHWKRLVRSELANGYDKATMATYQQTKDVVAIKYSAALNRCPICAGHQSFNRGFYSLDGSPDITGDTHPFCRCSKYPVYNLPRNVTV